MCECRGGWSMCVCQREYSQELSSQSMLLVSRFIPILNQSHTHNIRRANRTAPEVWLTPSFWKKAALPVIVLGDLRTLESFPPPPTDLCPSDLQISFILGSVSSWHHLLVSSGWCGIHLLHGLTALTLRYASLPMIVDKMHPAGFHCSFSIQMLFMPFLKVL